MTHEQGVVTAFDEAVGLGTVLTSAGQRLGFHCTQIADGSRTIAVGAAVAFEVLAGRHGQWEAGHVRAGEAYVVPRVPGFASGPGADREIST
ncbi:MAG: cold shock domain-containing protein [Actinomycetota bacterium]|nr:cold shock domain-containing protein [Actinomycetota bacterium]